MARTRAKGGAASSTASKQPPALTKKESRYTLPEEMDSPPQLFVLPKTASSESRVVTLQNPRLLKPTRYLVCPETGFYEFTRIAAPGSTPRSWLIDGASCVKNDGEDAEKLTTEDFQTHITKEGEIFVATPYDPLFLVLPALAAVEGKEKKRMFLTSDDHIDKLSESSPHLPHILRRPKTRALLEARMAAVCDTVEAGDENMYRLNENKLLGTLLAKARRLNLPKSMEEKFVLKPLEAPVLTRRSQAQPAPSAETSSETNPDTPMTEKTESQASISSVETTDSATTVASVSTTLTEPDDEPISAAMTPSPEVLSLQRLRVAFNFILASYLPTSLASVLKASLLSPESKTDFAPLEEYMSKLSKLKAEVLASRAATDYSRKRGLDDLEDDRAEKKRKKEEEEKRKKAGESRGVKNLKKVNVSGMKKMGDFFKKV
ncbi:ribonuclease H2, subunit B [Coniochaeta sp. 2T2.1]|nr:ribonuclease H2, subunit B [Coniochaeta sp. 2T2.1]